MPTKPTPMVLTNVAPDVLNAIRNEATQNYRNYVPYATPDAESVKAIGAVIMDNVALKNEFVNALINRIALVTVTSKLYSNPWSVFKRGLIELGESIEEIFVELIRVHQYDPEKAETELYKRELPDVRAAFHVLDYQKFYKVSISNQQLKTAFLSWQGVTDLIADITNKIYTSANYDEFLVMKYMLAKKIAYGQVKVIPTVDPANSADAAKAFIAAAKQVSNAWQFMSTDYNLAGVRTTCDKENQYVIIPAKYDALIDVNVLASAFNMDKTEFMGHKILIDEFTPTDAERLAEIFADDDTYVPLTSAEISALANVYGVIVDKDWFMIYDNLNEFAENFNGQGLYWQYFYHQWKTFSISPFSNAACFAQDGEVTAVTITPSEVTVTGTTTGKTIQLSAEVTATGIVSREVVWSVEEGGKATVDQRGLVTLGTLADGEDVDIIATSVGNDDVSETVTITRDDD